MTLVAQSINMFFAGADTELLDKALSPQLATWHYFFVVVMTPLILLNLLIALMGGVHDRVKDNEEWAELSDDQVKRTRPGFVSKKNQKFNNKNFMTTLSRKNV